MNEIRQAAEKWLNPVFDAETRAQVKRMLDENSDELTECFYRTLEFGTGGIRGIMGVGTNRMNVYTVGMATQGLCDYLLKCYAGQPEIRVVVGHDSRNNSRKFAESAAGIFSANGIKVFLFESLRPTPEISFAIRHLKCHSGVVVTASHNPKEYNGYKAYWGDGAQVIAPHDRNIIDCVNAITDISQVKFNGPQENITIIGKEIDEVYTDRIAALSLSPESIRKQSDLKIVYTPIHGTGVNLVPMVLSKLGFSNVIKIEEQCVIDGNFPTVKSPNPEESEALTLALKKASETDADILMGTDPDGDRVGLATKNAKGEWMLLNGNQSGSILIYYLLKRWKELGRIKGNEYIVKTIVTTDLMAEMAKFFSVECYDVLTGFKWIADVIARNEGKASYIGGGEESYGYLCGEFVRDKDAVMACAMFAEIAAWAKDNGKTFFDILVEIYQQFGMYLEKGVSLVRKGKSGAEEISAMMASYRANPLKSIGGSPIVRIIDAKESTITDLRTSVTEALNLPKSDVLQYFTENGIKVTVRPSGTEPKIKFYIGVKADFKDSSLYDETMESLKTKISEIASELGI